MKFKTTVLCSIAALAFSTVSVWAGVESIDDKQVLGNMQEHGLYMPQDEPVVLPESDERAHIPPELIEELEAEPVSEDMTQPVKKTQGI